MGSKSAVLGALCFLSVLAVACGSSGDGTEPTGTLSVESSTTTTAASSTTTEASTTTTTTPTTTATIEDLAETVGDPEAYLAEAQVVMDEIVGGVPDNVPLPDPTNADAAVALRSIFEFEWWTFTTRPSTRWADLYALVPTQAWVDSRNVGDRLSSVAAVFEFRGDPYEFHTSRVVPIEESGVTADVLEGLPVGSVSVEYESSIGPYEMVSPNSGEVWDDFPGWDRRPRYVILSPTETGWRVSWVGPLE